MTGVMGLKRNDLLLTAILVVLSLAALLAGRPSGTEDMLVAVVSVDGRELCRMPLDEEREFVWEGRVVVRAHEGAVRVWQADCPDQLCVRQGEISHSGQSIVCLPNRLAVTLESAQAEYDAVLY